MKRRVTVWHNVTNKTKISQLKIHLHSVVFLNESLCHTSIFGKGLFVPCNAPTIGHFLYVVEFHLLV